MNISREQLNELTEVIEDTIQYEMYLNKDKNTGDFIANPVTRLTRDVEDADTITVESTLGFPEQGILFIGLLNTQKAAFFISSFFSSLCSVKLSTCISFPVYKNGINARRKFKINNAS